MKLLVSCALAVVLGVCLPAAAAASDPVLAAAGDIACPPGSVVDAADCNQGQTSNLLLATGPSAVAVLGDDQYQSGLYSEFTGSGAFDQTWGRVKSLIHPAPGNHEYYASTTAAGYFQYFGGAAGPAVGYYSYNLGAWHVVSLNSNCVDAGCQYFPSGGQVPAAEVSWLQSDLAAHPGMCTLAYWHHPRFSSGPVGPSPGVGPLWQALYAGHADVVLNGHDHDYERFAPQDPNGAATPAGIRELVAGTGGDDLYGDPSTLAPNSQFTDGHDFGVLFLTLHTGSYDWRFENEAGAVVDSGSTACHWQPPAVTTGSATQVASSAATLNGSVNPNGQAASYRFQYGLSRAYGQATSTQTLAAGSSTVALAQTLTGLAPDTIYHYRLLATSNAGTTYGQDHTFSTTPASSYAAAVTATPGVRAFWRLGEPSGATAYDSISASDGAYHGGVTLGQPGAVAGSMNTAASFDGTGYASPPVLGTTTNLTVEGWSDLTSAAATNPYGNNALYGHYGDVRLILRPSGFYAGAWIGGTEYHVAGATASNIGGWVHWALVRYGATLTVYRNGALAGSISNLPTGSVTLGGTIGAYSGMYFTHGAIDEVAVYAAALSAATIQQHYALGGV